MENQIYRIKLSGDALCEFYVCKTNEVNPVRNILEMGVVILDRSTNLQLDGDIELDELDSFINYLQDCRNYIKEFNKNSKPKR
jgi:hypothetical protein